MSQNTSTAVMQRRIEAHDSLDDFPTPPWATRALIEHVILPDLGLSGRKELQRATVLEPACNRGYMARPLSEYFHRVVASDILDYGIGAIVGDFLFPGDLPAASWVVTNPPFRLGQQFIERSFELKEWQGTAMIVRTAFLEGGGRYKELFSRRPPSTVAQFAERVIMTKGIVRDPSKEYWDDIAKKMRRPSTATSYCWLVWQRNAPRGTRMVWIPPCRKQMERGNDYA